MRVPLGVTDNIVYIWANSTAKTAETDMVVGECGWQVDTNIVYRYSGSAWVLYRTQT